MDKLLAFITAIILGIALTATVGFVVSSVNGYDFVATTAIPIGAILGAIIFFFGMMVRSEKNQYPPEER